MSKNKIVCPTIKLVSYDFLGYNIRINEKHKHNFINAKLNILQLYPTLIFKLYRVDSYNCRYIGGTKILSYHSYGQAVDINPNDFPISKNPYEIPDWYLNIAQCFKLAGFRWGGDWNTIFDPMHFEVGTRKV